MNARYVNDLIERASLDDRTRARMRFFARQILDALSPSNYLATNPQAIRRAMETGGDSLATGVRNLLEDLGKGRISMTDEQAFEVGRNLAITPGSVVFENELLQLIQYQPLTETVGARPLVLIPPSINKFYVFDLQPANSFVRYAVEQGNTVFIVSWRNVMAEQGHLTWDDYLTEGIMRAIDVAREITGADKVNALGFCVGGTMLGCAASVMAARNEDKIESLTFLTTMLDFTQAGEIALLIDEQSVAAREQTIGGGGILPGRELAFVFSTLRGNDLDLALRGRQLSRRAPAGRVRHSLLERRQHRSAGPHVLLVCAQHLPGEQPPAARETTQCGVKVDLSAIDVPTYVLASREDHIVPWRNRLPDHATGVRRRALRARSKRPHRGCDQSGGAQQAQLLGRRRAGQAARALAGDGARDARKLVVGLERLASFSRRHAGACTHAPGQHRVSRDRACARPLRHGARRLNQIWRLEEER